MKNSYVRLSILAIIAVILLFIADILLYSAFSAAVASFLMSVIGLMLLGIFFIFCPLWEEEDEHDCARQWARRWSTTIYRAVKRAAWSA